MRDNRLRSVLIFGGAGFIGSNLAHELLVNTEAKVHVFDNLSRAGVRHNIQWLQRAAKGSRRLQITIGDVRDAAMVERAVRHATEIYHFAAQVAVTNSISDPRFDFEVNLLGTFNVLEAARKWGKRPFLLFTSTNKVYGEMPHYSVTSCGNRHKYKDISGINESEQLDFHSPYGCSKGAADQYVRDYARIYGIPTVVFRMSCIAGERQFGTEDQGWVAHFLYSALRERPLAIYGDGKQVRDILDVRDLIRAFELARGRAGQSEGQIYNVGGGPENTISLLELIDEIERLTGHRLEFRNEPTRPGDQLIYVTDTSKLETETGWKRQFNVRDTLEHILEFWKRNRSAFSEAATVPDRTEVRDMPVAAPNVGLVEAGRAA